MAAIESQRAAPSQVMVPLAKFLMYGFFSCMVTFAVRHIQKHHDTWDQKEYYTRFTQEEDDDTSTSGAFLGNF